MSVSATQERSFARNQGSVVVCDASSFNLRFLRAAMTKLGFRQVLEAKTLEELEHKATVMQPDLVVFDPSMEHGAGIDLIKGLQSSSPETLIVAFCSDENLARTLKLMGITMVEKVSILQVDLLVATIQSALGLSPVIEPEAIPVNDIAIPVWDQVPSLVEA
jgi:DNA-binding NarL/FixJ family response regulator